MIRLLVLVCSLNTPCDSHHARASMPLPDRYATPIACLMAGPATLASTELGRSLRADETVRFSCEPERVKQVAK